MKKILLLLLLILPIATAKEFNIENNSIEELQEIITRKDITVPNSVRFLVNENEKINLIITEDSKTIMELNTILENYKVTQLNEGLSEDASIEIIATKSAVNEISTTENIKETSTRLINNKEIEIKPQGFILKSAFAFTKLFLKFF